MFEVCRPREFALSESITMFRISAASGASGSSAGSSSSSQACAEANKVTCEVRNEDIMDQR